MFSLSTGHYLNCPVQRCTHEHLSTAYFMQCNSPQSLFFPPQVFLSACPILNRSSGSRTLVVKSTSALPCNLFEWQYLIYSLRRGGSLCVGGVVGGREGGGLWFSYVPTLKNIPPRCWQNTATSSLFFSLSFSKLKVLFCVFFRNHMLASRTTPSVARALYFLLVEGILPFEWA